MDSLVIGTQIFADIHRYLKLWQKFHIRQSIQSDPARFLPIYQLEFVLTIKRAPRSSSLEVQTME